MRVLLYIVVQVFSYSGGDFFGISGWIIPRISSSERDLHVYRYYSETHFLYNNGSINARILYEVTIMNRMRKCGAYIIMKYKDIYSTSANDSLEYENTAILLMSSRKRMILNKTRLTDNRKSSSKNLPEPIPIQRFIKFSYPYKKSKFLYTDTKNRIKKHWWWSVLFSFSELE